MSPAPYDWIRDEHLAALRRVALGAVLNVGAAREEAEDAAGEAMRALVRIYDRGHPVERWEGYAKTTALRAYFAATKRAARRQAAEDGARMLDVDPAAAADFARVLDEAAQEDAAQRMRRAFAWVAMALRPSQRAALLREHGGDESDPHWCHTAHLADARRSLRQPSRQAELALALYHCVATIPDALGARLKKAPFGTGECALQVMAYLADVARIHEDDGANKDKRGWISRFLKNLGLAPGQPWCAASLHWACVQAGCARPPTGGASVYEWVVWAQREGRLLKTPKRGCALARLGPNHLGHIAICKGVEGADSLSIEGNTSAGAAGSQRDGGGMYRRKRPTRVWMYFIDLDVRR